jgi:flagellar biosynthesis/type III secretory pathway protein FliH
MFTCLEHAIPVQHEEFLCPICNEECECDELAVDDAYWKGYREGQEDGYNNGHAEGYKEGLREVKIKKEQSE